MHLFLSVKISNKVDERSFQLDKATGEVLAVSAEILICDFAMELSQNLGY
ncbi:predicted protein [Sclerotinia sclerotiorum 1980 UF-70]|uniref:Uncharacterized protein n=1 Tax=Sclerotinia sclerotiorum (strain ATCC 18683 / 1980 / Ss-1) TaxID=665079 RepID=A7EMP3_SCLS1|nr:predicted protein [Sclerotinia sclerotiorum 1980 UF-70]EDO04109.1 predicted protein [Sclerotinia sclerotiorum 1980 UF-70]